MTTDGRRFPRDDRPVRRRGRPTKIRNGAFTGVIIMLSVVAAVVFGISVFFKVNHITVRGNSVYDVQTILDASGISQGDNLLSVSRAKAAARIEALLPYVEHVRISRVLPDTIVLEITESDMIFSVQSQTGEMWLMNARGKMLEAVTEEKAAQYPMILGFAVIAPTPGEEASASSPESLNAALSLMEAIDGTGLADKIAKVDAGKSYDLTLWYEEQFEIRLGTVQELEYKIKYLQAVLKELKEHQTGTIDLTFQDERVAKFVPW